MESVLRAYTCNGAYASFEEKIRGTLAEGMLADAVVLSQDMIAYMDSEAGRRFLESPRFDIQPCLSP